MKVTGIFVLLFLTVCVFSDVQGDEESLVDCVRYLKVVHTDGKEVLACPAIFRQICGTNGKTYQNECKLCAHNLEFGDNVSKKYNGRCKEEQ